MKPVETSLYPIPGSKRSRKYNMLAPSPGQLAICEPFMGGAARSILHSPDLRPILGEINPAQRAIALAPTTEQRRQDYITSYNYARNEFCNGIDLDRIFRFVGQKNTQKVFKESEPDLYEEMRDRWLKLRQELFAAMTMSDASVAVAGYYSFMQRACFGAVMRLNPAGTEFNVSWHLEKLQSAVRFNPDEWCDSFAKIEWKPTVLNDWQRAIETVKNPRKTYLLLDPPYWVDGETVKCTPAYPGHRIGLKNDHDETFELSTLPLIAGFKRRFPLIHLCNYYSERLEAEIVQLAFSYGYAIGRIDLGLCGALGNSNGRLVHGERRDKRERPIECIWEFRPMRQLSFSFAA